MEDKKLCISKDKKLLYWRCLQVFFKTYLEDVFRTSWGPTHVCWGYFQLFISFANLRSHFQATYILWFVITASVWSAVFFRVPLDERREFLDIHSITDEMPCSGNVVFVPSVTYNFCFNDIKEVSKGYFVRSTITAVYVRFSSLLHISIVFR